MNAEEIFHAALARPPAERSAFLALKQAKIPSPQGIYFLVDGDVSSLCCPRTGS